MEVLCCDNDKFEPMGAKNALLHANTNETPEERGDMPGEGAGTSVGARIIILPLALSLGVFKHENWFYSMLNLPILHM